MCSINAHTFNKMVLWNIQIQNKMFFWIRIPDGEELGPESSSEILVIFEFAGGFELLLLSYGFFTNSNWIHWQIENRYNNL